MSDLAYYRILEYLLRASVAVHMMRTVQANPLCTSSTPVLHSETMLYDACLSDEECRGLYAQDETTSLTRFRRILASTGAVTLEAEYQAVLCPERNDTAFFQHMLKYWHARGPHCDDHEVWRHGMCECRLGHDCETGPYTNVNLLVFFVLLSLLFLIHVVVSFHTTRQILETFEHRGLRQAYEKGIYSSRVAKP